MVTTMTDFNFNTRLIRTICELWSQRNTNMRGSLVSIIQPPPGDYTPTQRRLHEMMQENTGAHLLDSGDAYGRAWERHRAVTDFRRRPRVHTQVYRSEVCLTHDTFHVLDDALTLTPGAVSMQRDFQEFCEGTGRSGLQAAVAYCDHLVERGLAREHNSHNSYNWENDLSTTIQWTWLTMHDGEVYVLMQIHGGCDVRGGYTEPQVFRVEDYECLFRSGDFYARCRDCGRTWTTDDGGWHWYPDDHGETLTRDNEYDDQWDFFESVDLVMHIGCCGEIVFG